MTRTRPTRRQITHWSISAAFSLIVVVGVPLGYHLAQEHARTTNLVNLAAAQRDYAAVIDLANDARDRLIQANPDTLTPGGPPDAAIWNSCGESAWSDSDWDSPEKSAWNSGTGGIIEPRQATIDLIEPVLQSYLDDGWYLSRDRRDIWGFVVVAKGDYSVHIQGTSQEDLDDDPDRDARLRVDVYSPCRPAPNNLTQWDHDNPDDFSFATQEPPAPTW
jgi:hypothetical protein